MCPHMQIQYTPIVSRGNNMADLFVHATSKCSYVFRKITFTDAELNKRIFASVKQDILL